MDFEVYAIRSEETGRIYIGQTECFERRLCEHNNGSFASTRNDRPWEVVKKERCESRNAARWLESQLKNPVVGAKDGYESERTILKRGYPPEGAQRNPTLGFSSPSLRPYRQLEGGSLSGTCRRDRTDAGSHAPVPRELYQTLASVVCSPSSVVWFQVNCKRRVIGVIQLLPAGT